MSQKLPSEGSITQMAIKDERFGQIRLNFQEGYVMAVGFFIRQLRK